MQTPESNRNGIVLILCIFCMLFASPSPAQQTCATYYNRYGRLITECSDPQAEQALQYQQNLDAQRFEMQRQYLEQENQRRNYEIQVQEAERKARAQEQERRAQQEAQAWRQQQFDNCFAQIRPSYPNERQLVEQLCHDRLGF